MSQRRACRLVSLGRKAAAYRTKPRNDAVRMRDEEGAPAAGVNF
jgi:hypothetical protein